jgi:hypothetical protein
VKVRITKAQAVEAIRTETLLTHGDWISYLSDDQKLATCRVCAVGAVLRSLLRPDVQPPVLNRLAKYNTFGELSVPNRCTIALSEEATHGLLSRGKVWNALSTLFEGYWRLYNSQCVLPPDEREFGNRDAIRERVVTFVETHFPEDWELDDVGCGSDADVFKPEAVKEVS